jgi:ATP:ADP antiporter, AAA family
MQRLKAVFGDIRPGEWPTVLLLAANVFLLLTSYYLLKVVREPLILAGGGGAEVKSYSAAGQAILLLGVVKVFDALSRRYGRMKLIAVTMGFFVVTLVLFVVAGRAGLPVGVPFYLWLGVFNMTAVAQFWSLANDVYTTEQGKRVFAFIGVGASIGAVVGAWAAGHLFDELGPFLLMLIAAVMMAACLGLSFAVDRREHPEKTTKAPPPVGGDSAIKMLLADRYLMWMAVLVFVVNLINTNGEYILDRTLVEAAKAQGLDEAAMKAYIAEFKGDFFVWVNIIGVFLQMFVVSRLIQYLGLRVAVFIYPVIVLGGYVALAIAPVLAVIRISKIAENSIDYSVQNTTRHALFLPTSRAAKFKVKALIDGFLVRMSDVASSGIVYVGTTLAIGTKGFIFVNIGVILCALGAAAIMSRLVSKREDGEAAKQDVAPAT